MKVNLGKTKVTVCGCITQDGLSKSEVDPCEVCCLRVKANSVLCVQCGKWIHGRCAVVKKVTPNFKKIYMQEMLMKYWRGSVAGRSHVMKWKRHGNLHILETG